MKSFFCFFLVISISLISFGQDEGYQTIFKNSKDSTKVSGFGAVTMDFGSVNGDLALMMGGEGAVLINRSFYVGFYGRGLTTQPTYQYSKFDSRFGRNILKTQRAAFGHGGLIIGGGYCAKKTNTLWVFGANLEQELSRCLMTITRAIIAITIEIMQP